MLKGATPFPLVGSYGLLTLEPRDGPELARIIGRSGDQALVSLPLRRGSTGNTTVPLSAIVDGTPLSQSEDRELGELGTKGLTASLAGLHPKRNLSARQRKRFDLLRDRKATAARLSQLLMTLEKAERRSIPRAA